MPELGGDGLIGFFGTEYPYPEGRPGWGLRTLDEHMNALRADGR